MAYVDHAFSITDDDDLVGGAVGGPRGAPVKEIAFAAALLAFGVLGVVAGSFMTAHQVGGDSAHGIFFAVLGVVMFIPGFYYTRIAYYAYKGYKASPFRTYLLSEEAAKHSWFDCLIQLYKNIM